MINCAAVPESLFESELFGHERGAFSGSSGLKKGLFELADSGTLFLDEVGEIPLGLQAKLLRVLETGEFRRVGGTHTLTANVRPAYAPPTAGCWMKSMPNASAWICITGWRGSM